MPDVRGGKHARGHTAGCAIRRADAFIRTTKDESANSHHTQRKTT
jgi:hypothetical protein